uniref:(northern house mosquito) hypothetical protein n=1 Tax=Culex pipiens TaxID=7175 RepID=A0A8D8K9Y7_CULPI
MTSQAALGQLVLVRVTNFPGGTAPTCCVLTDATLFPRSEEFGAIHVGIDELGRLVHVSETHNQIRNIHQATSTKTHSTQFTKAVQIDEVSSSGTFSPIA